MSSVSVCKDGDNWHDENDLKECIILCMNRGDSK